MRSARHLDDLPAGAPLLAEDLTEFHAARLLLLLHECGVRGHIEGLTKLAKLDFFVRYPSFFEQACMDQGKPFTPVAEAVESPMVRYHYGPWDHRYYQVLAFLEARSLITISKFGNSFDFMLTPDGVEAAVSLSNRLEYTPLITQMKQVKRAFGTWKGNSLKSPIYKVFDKEIVDRRLGEVIGL